MQILTMLGFKKAIDKIRTAPTLPRLVERIDAAQIRHDPQPDLVDGKPFVPGECYFGLRLAGLHLKDARRFAQQVLPLCICLAEFQQSGKRQAVPFSLGPDTIRQRLQPAFSGVGGDTEPHPGWVELRDIEIVHPTPMSLANLEAFIGLYAVPGDDIARTLLNVMGSISQAFAGGLSPAFGIAEKVYDGFTALLGVKGVTPEVEALHGNLLTKSGYLLVSNAPDDSPLKGKMFVSGGRLRQGEAPESPVVTGFDYCLIAVQRRETVIDISSNAPDLFGTLWTRVVEAFEGSTDAAHDAFKRLQRVIYGSPDLIARDRDALLAGYLVEYQKAVQILGQLAPPQPKGRGAAGENITKAVSRIPKLYAALMEKPKGAATDEIRKRWASGSGAWMRAGQLRYELNDTPAGFVGDTIIRAL
ncbi:hypothetical protein [Bradyrhizobium sp. ARR65]|uniref:hypothetical protein n=1 Tax=Bradyrhizobium sp. ARR65 TaxID=1040989 RepID=UPI000B1ADFFD|nr:hypothetical protein [Bradyrhizobium sp. ARR65]